jgi:ectoine hydroxylase
MELHTDSTREDLYPSRTGATASILARLDPVVRGSAADGPLGPDALAFFQRHGYLLFRGLIRPDEVDAYQAEMRAIWAARQGDGGDEVIREPDGDDVRSVFRIHETSDLFSRVCRDPRLLGAAMQILGSGVYIHHSRINYKPGFSGKEFYWHSDFETWHTEDGLPRMRGLSVSVALTENTEHNGPLMVIPGSHQHYVSCPGETPEDHFRSSLRRQESGVPDPDSLRFLLERRTDELTAAKGPPGTVLLFDSNLMHGSNSNISPDPRSVLYFVYNSVENTPEAPFNGRAPRPPFLRSLDFTPLRPVQG